MKKFRINPIHYAKPVYWHHNLIHIGLNAVYSRKWLLPDLEIRMMKIMPNTRDKRRFKNER